MAFPSPFFSEPASSRLDTLIIDSVVDFAIIAMDSEGIIVRWNEGACRLLGWSAEEMLGQPSHRFFTPEDKLIHRLETEMEQALLLGRSQDERWHLRKNGERFWSSGEMMPLKDEQARHIGFVKVLSDRTAQRLAVTDVLQQREQLQSEVQTRTWERDRIWAVSPDLIAILDEAGVFQAVNPAWSRTLGHAAASLLGLSLSSLIHPEDAERARVLFAPAEAGAHTGELECRLRAGNGSYHWFNWSRVVEEALIYVSGRDISAIRTQHEALQAAQDALRQSQKMEAVGQLTGGIAHDFNNMLGSISGNLDMLKLYLEQGQFKELPRYVEGALNATERAAGLTQRLLAFSRRQTLAPEAVAVNPVVLSMEDLLRRTVGPQISLQTRLGSALWKVLCDPNQLENALLNLAINSRDAMPQGGRLTIETGNCHFDAATAPPELEAGEYVRIAVEDSGSGMTEEVAQRVLEPFFTTKPAGQGTGLGLSMIYAFVTQSHGHLRIRSRVDAGTEVELFLPRYQGPDEETELRQKMHGLPQAGQAATVLLMEEDDALRELTGEMLSVLGYESHGVASGDAALEWLRAHPQVDLLLIDLGWREGMTGQELVQAIQRHAPQAKLLFITGNSAMTSEDMLALLREQPVLSKPFSLHQLAEAAEALLRPKS